MLDTVLNDGLFFGSAVAARNPASLPLCLPMFFSRALPGKQHRGLIITYIMVEVMIVYFHGGLLEDPQP